MSDLISREALINTAKNNKDLTTEQKQIIEIIALQQPTKYNPNCDSRDLIDRDVLLLNREDWTPYEIVQIDGEKHGLYIDSHIDYFIKQQVNVMESEEE